MVTALTTAARAVSGVISFSTVSRGPGPDDTFMTDTLSELFRSEFQKPWRPVCVICMMTDPTPSRAAGFRLSSC